MPVGNQRIIGVQFLIDAGRLEDFFDAQHFLDLVFDGQCILEIEAGVLSECQLTLFLVLQHLAAKTGALLCVLLQRPEVGAG